MSETATDERHGSRIITASWIGTLVFAVTALPTVIPVHAFDTLSIAAALALFAISIPLWLYGFVIGVTRSRTELVTIGGLFFLHGAAPPIARRLLLGSFATTLLVTVITAAAEPFGVLVPVLPLALAGLWAARHGTFAPRPEPPPKRGARTTVAASVDESAAEQSQ